MAFDIEGAKKAGASDEQIAEYLAKKHGFNLEGATKAGAKASDVITHLMKKEGGSVEKQAPDESAAETARLAGKEAPKAEAPGIVEQMFGLGSPIARVVKGAVVDPLLGINQLMANTGLFGDTVKQSANQLVKGYEGATQEARARVGSEGFDPYQLGGAIVSPINKLGAVGQGGSVVSKIGSGAGAGVIQGLIAPTQTEGDEGSGDRLVNAALGAAFGAGIPATAEGAKQVWQIIRRLPISADAKLRALQKHLGEKIPVEAREEISSELRTAKPATEGYQQSAAEALADQPKAIELMKEQERALAATPSAARTRDLENQQAIQTQMEGAFGKAEDIPVAEQFRDVRAGAMREQALADADKFRTQVIPAEQAAVRADVAAEGQLAKQASELEGAAAKDVEFQAGKPGWLTAGTQAFEKRAAAQRAGDKAGLLKAEADVKRMQAQAIKDEGFYPLEIDSIVKNIEKELADPMTKVDDTLISVLNSTQRKLMDAVDPETGIINSDVLYKVRKLINQDIQKALAGQKVTDAPAVEKKVRDILDKSIEKASGGNLWSKYLTEYSERSTQIDQMKLGRDLLGKLGVDSASGAQKAGTFVQAVNNVTDTIKDITGRSYDKLEDFATPRQVNILKSVASDVSRKERASLAASYGKASEGVQPESKNLPALLDKGLTLTKTIIGWMQHGSQKEFDAKIADLMLNPQKLATFIDNLPKDRMNTVVELMVQRMSPEMRASFLKIVPKGEKVLDELGTAETAIRDVSGAAIRGGVIRDVGVQRQ